MTTKLRLHVPSSEAGMSGKHEPRMVIKFPGQSSGRAEDGRWHGPRLVSEENDAASHATIDAEDLAVRPISSGDLVRQIESTLDRMQSRLDRFKREMNDTYKFPELEEDDDRPYAA